MNTDVHQALKEAENSLRDFIGDVLAKRFGSNWISECGISVRKIKRWKQLKAEEAERQRGGLVEERLLYYSNLLDLKTILAQNWLGEFEKVFGDRRTIEVFIDELVKLRDPHAHQRELLPHQKHLVLGLSGEIRNRLIKYRSKMETGEDYYPRLESIRDSLGHVWVPADDTRLIFDTRARLRPGDPVEWVVSATDPMDDTLSYNAAITGGRETGWQENNVLSLTMTNADVGRSCFVSIHIRSPREYHARGEYDDYLTFEYEVLQPKQ